MRYQKLLGDVLRMAVPTGDAQVKAKLREFGEPAVHPASEVAAKSVSSKSLLFRKAVFSCVYCTIIYNNRVQIQSRSEERHLQ